MKWLKIIWLIVYPSLTQFSSLDRSLTVDTLPPLVECLKQFVITSSTPQIKAIWGKCAIIFLLVTVLQNKFIQYMNVWYGILTIQRLLVDFSSILRHFDSLVQYRYYFYYTLTFSKSFTIVACQWFWLRLCFKTFLLLNIYQVWMDYIQCSSNFWILMIKIYNDNDNKETTTLWRILNYTERFL